MIKGKFAIGAIIGAVAGVIAGVLTAPKSGKATRADIKNKASELKQEAAKRAEETKGKSAKAAADLKHKADDYKERGGRAIDGAVEGAKKGFFSKKK